MGGDFLLPNKIDNWQFQQMGKPKIFELIWSDKFYFLWEKIKKQYESVKFIEKLYLPQTVDYVVPFYNLLLDYSSYDTVFL